MRYFKFCDGNTKFFHAIATERFRSNSIASLKLSDDSVVVDHVGKEAILYHTFRERLGQSSATKMQFDLDGLNTLSIPFTHEEIDEVIKVMSSDRAPGPDGFNGCFLKSCWHIIKYDFYKLCEDFS